MTAPASYPGGKGACFRRLVNLMPPHRVYIESHLGAGAVLRMKAPAAASIGIDRDSAVIARWREGSGCVPALAVVNGDASSFLARYPFKGDELVYCDPPYVHSTRAKPSMYRCEMSDADHRRLLSVLVRLPCAVMISGYRSEIYDAALGTWVRHEFPNTTRGGAVTESVWCNFESPAVPHDTRYIGDTFRDRERARRQQRRWARRFANMVPAQQRAVLIELLELASPEVASGAGGILRDSLLTAPAASPGRAMEALTAGNGDASLPRREGR